MLSISRAIRAVVSTCAGFGVALTLSGCATELDVRRMEANSPRVGVGYILPFTQYKATITWRVAECIAGITAVPATGTAPAVEAARPGIRIVTKVEIGEGQADDAEHAYITDPSQLQTLLSISNLQMTWQDGRNLFSTINVSSEDRSAQVVGGAVAGLGKLALALAAPGAAAVEGATPAQACSDETVAALEASVTQKAELAVASTRVKAAQAVLKTATDKVAIMGSAVNDAARDELASAIDGLNAALRTQAVKAEALAESLELLSYTEVVNWPEDSLTFATAEGDASRLPRETFNRWAKVERSEADRLLEQTQVFFQIERVGSFGRSVRTERVELPRDPARPSDPPRYEVRTTVSEAREPRTLVVGERLSREDRSLNENGLRYRVPAIGRLYACASVPCNASAPEIYATLQGPVAQLGFVNVLPVRTRPFGSTAFSATLSPMGALRSAGYEQRTAPAEGIGNIFTSLVDAGVPLIDYEAGREGRQQATELANLEFLKKRRDALSALEPSAANPASVAAGVLTADTALLDAQIANLEARIELVETERRLTGLTPAP